MTKKELTLLRVTGLNAATKLKFMAAVKSKDLTEWGICNGILQTVYLLSPNEYTNIHDFITSHFHAKYTIHNGDFYKIKDALQEDYFKQYDV